MDRDIAQGRLLLESGRISEQILTGAYNSGQCSPTVDLCQVLLQSGYLDPQSAQSIRHAASLQTQNPALITPIPRQLSLRERPPLSPEELSHLWQSSYANTPLETLNPSHTMRQLKSQQPRLQHSQEPGFQFISELGRGGMGLVYKAFQKTLQREVAIKKILPDQSSAEVQQAFISESLVSASLDHPGVAPIYDLITNPNGELELAMKVVTGHSWKDILHPNNSEQEELARKRSQDDELNTLSQLCNTLAFAHSKGIAHCDLKPENVMIGQFGEVYLMDWGIAVSFDPKADHLARSKRSISSPCGTPRYMAPELADGSGEEIGPWTDVFLLGAILHEILLGVPPHKGESFIQIVIAASRSAIIEMPPLIPEELQKICQTAMNRIPEERYNSVLDFQSALKDYMTHKESHKISERAHERLADCLGQQHRKGLNESTTQELYRKFAHAVASFQQALELWPGNESARKGKVKASLAFGQAALENGDILFAKAQVTAIKSDPAAKDLLSNIGREMARRRSQILRGRVLKVAMALSIVVIIVGLSAGLYFIQEEKSKADAARRVAEDQRRIAQKNVLEAERQRSRADQQLTQNSQFLAESFFQSGRQHLEKKNNLQAQLSFSKAASLHDTPKYRGHYFSAVTQNQFKESCVFEHSVWPPDSYLLKLAGRGSSTKIIAKKKGEVVIYNFKGKILQRWQAQNKDISGLEVSGDAQSLLSFTVGGSLNLWDVKSGQLKKQLLASAPSTHPVSVNEDGSVVVYYHGTGKRGLVWRQGQESQNTIFKGILAIRGVANSEWLVVHKNFNNSVLVDSNGKTIRKLGKARIFLAATIDEVSGDLIMFCHNRSQTVSKYRYPRQGNSRPTMAEWELTHEGYHASSLSGDGKTLITWSPSNIKIWSSETGQLRGQISRPELDFTKAAVNYDGTALAAIDSSGQIRAWTMKWTPPLQYSAPNRRGWAPINDFTFAADNSLFVIVNSRSIRQFNVATKKTILVKSSEQLKTLSASMKHREIAFLDRDQPTLYNIDDRSFLRPFSKKVASIAYFGTQILMREGKRESRFSLVDRDKLDLKKQIVLPANVARKIVMISPGPVFIYGNYQTLHYQSLNPGDPSKTLNGHKQEILVASTSADGQRLISADRGRKVYVWELKSGRPLCSLRGHQFLVTAALLNKDGSLAITADSNGNLFFWSVRKQTMIARFKFPPDRNPRLKFNSDESTLAYGQRTALHFIDMQEFERLQSSKGQKLYREAEKDTGLTFVGANIQALKKAAKK